MTKEKNKKSKFIFKKSILFLGSLFLFFSFGMGNVLAEDKIDVEYPVGTNLNGGEIFEVKNILPGWEESKTIRVENDSETDDVNLYFTFDVNGDKKLAEKLKLYVIRLEDGSYRIGGSGDRYTLKKADDERLYVGRLSATKGKQFKIKIVFDKKAGNEYQGLEAKFDIDFRIESVVAGAETEDEILTGEGRTGFTGTEPTEAEEEAEVQGEESSGGGESGGIEGEEDKCQSWPMWVWILSLVVFAGVLVLNEWKNYKKEEYGWKFTFFWTILAVAFWYYFDKCREFHWFLYTSIAISIIYHFIYLHFLKKRISEPEKTKID
jgi:hypothetical protein